MSKLFNAVALATFVNYMPAMAQDADTEIQPLIEVHIFPSGSDDVRTEFLIDSQGTPDCSARVQEKLEKEAITIWGMPLKKEAQQLVGKFILATCPTVNEQIPVTACAGAPTAASETNPMGAYSFRCTETQIFDPNRSNDAIFNDLKASFQQIQKALLPRSPAKGIKPAPVIPAAQPPQNNGAPEGPNRSIDIWNPKYAISFNF